MSAIAPRIGTVRIPVSGVSLDGDLVIPSDADGIVVFAHGSGSSRHSPRNKFVAGVLHRSKLATLLLDLLTADEESVDTYTRHLRFDIDLLASRLVATVKSLGECEVTKGLRIGLFGASTGGAAALVAAAELGDVIGAAVSRGGRPDLAGDALSYVRAPVLLIVGGLDNVVINLNQEAYAKLNCKKELKIIPGASHLFEEPGTLEEVADLSAAWFMYYLGNRAIAGDI